jgi:hypothetical protein
MRKVQAMPATMAPDAVVLTVEHLRGCPVPFDPSNERLAARVEYYRVQKDGLRLNYEGTRLETPWYTVAHCCECGALTYHEER